MIPSLDVTADDVLVLQKRRSDWRGYAGGRLSSDSEQAGARRRERHASHFRRSHERHGVRDDRAAHLGRKRPSADRSGLVRTGDRIHLSVRRRGTLDVLLSESELEARRQPARGPPADGPFVGTHGSTPSQCSARSPDAISISLRAAPGVNVNASSRPPRNRRGPV